MTNNIDDIIPTASYSAFIHEDNDSGIAHQVGIVRGTSAKIMLENSTRPELLEFHLL